MKWYILISAIIFIIFGVSWSKSNVLNFMVKALFILMGIIGIIYSLEAFGYIFKTE